MHIALVVPGGVDRSGVYRVIPALLALIGRLARRHRVTVFALTQEPEPGAWQLAGAQIHNIGHRHMRVRAVRAIRTLHRRSGVDVVHAIWSGWPGLIAVAAARSLGLPSLVHVTGGEVVALREIGYGGRLTWRGRVRESVVLRAASAVSASSTPVVELLSQLGVGATRVPLGVDFDAWPPQPPRLRDPSRAARLVQVASLNRVKDQPTLLRALAILVRAGVRIELDVIGEDTLGGEMQRLTDELGLLSHVKFHGFLTQQQLRPLVSESDLMIVSSRHEAGPAAMLEAAAVGVPTIGTAVGHIVEWAPDAAVAVPIAQPSALASAIQRVLNDEAVRMQLAQAAHVRALREDADYTASKFEALYAELSKRQ